MRKTSSRSGVACRIATSNGFPLTEDRGAAAAEGAERVERSLPRAQVDEVPDGDELLGDAGPAVAVLEPHQPIRLGIGQRPEERRVDHREHGDVGADAERQRQDRGEGESRLADEQPQGVTDVMKEHGGLDEGARGEVGVPARYNPPVPRSTRSPEPSVTALVTLLAVNLVAAGVLGYSNSFGGPFVLDDFPSITHNPSIFTSGRRSG